MNPRARLCRRHIPCVGEVQRLGTVRINGQDVDLDAAPKPPAGAVAPDSAPAGPPQERP